MQPLCLFAHEREVLPGSCSSCPPSIDAALRMCHGASPQAPQIAKKYWKLGDDAGMRELLLVVRADEAGALLCLDSLNAQTPKTTQKQVLLALRLAF